MSWLPRQHAERALQRASDAFDACVEPMRFAQGAAAGLSPERFFVHAAHAHGVLMRPLDPSHSLVMMIIRPLLPGVTPPPYGFLCKIAADKLHAAADASGQAHAALMGSPGAQRSAFLPLVYRGRTAEDHFPPGVPTCTRLLLRNPANSV